MALVKAERRIKAVEKKLASAQQGQPGDAGSPAAGVSQKAAGAAGKARSPAAKGSPVPTREAAPARAKPDTAPVSPEWPAETSTSDEPAPQAAAASS